MNNYKIVVIGSGFGGTMTTLAITEHLKTNGEKILMLERGTSSGHY
jgi:NADH dehydrogenase FAD-containing subunit